nr:MAG TPA: hypothetical protein [Bacteriophage sp.]
MAEYIKLSAAIEAAKHALNIPTTAPTAGRRWTEVNANDR